MGRLEAALADWETVAAQNCGDQLQVDDWCGRCFGPQHLEALSGPPDLVRESLLPSVAAKEPGHWGDAFPSLYRRLAPRIVAEVVHHRLHVDESLIASRLVQAGWQDWPEDERRALEHVLDAWWAETLAIHPREGAPWQALEFLTVPPAPSLPGCASGPAPTETPPTATCTTCAPTGYRICSPRTWGWGSTSSSRSRPKLPPGSSSRAHPRGAGRAHQREPGEDLAVGERSHPASSCWAPCSGPHTDHRLAAVPGPVSGAGPAESSAVCQRAAVMPGSSDGRAMSCSSRAGAFPSSRSYADRSTVSAPVCLQAAQDDDVAAGGVLDVQGPDVGFGLGLAGEVEPVGAQVFAVLGASWSGEPPEWAAEEARR
jgi:hypothetical protein